MSDYPVTRHYTGVACPVCGEPMATDGTGSWCSDKPHHTLPAPMPSLPRCEHGAAFGVAGGCTDCAMADDDGAGLARGGAS